MTLFSDNCLVLCTILIIMLTFAKICSNNVCVCVCVSYVEMFVFRVPVLCTLYHRHIIVTMIIYTPMLL